MIATFTDGDGAVSLVRLNVPEQAKIAFSRGFRTGSYTYQVHVAGRWQATGSLEVGDAEPAVVSVPLRANR